MYVVSPLCFLICYYASKPYSTHPIAEAAYVDPSTFIPERWYKYPNLVRDKSAFGPFGIGKCTSSHLTLYLGSC
jgi:cytochrome P450